ncbi:MAG: hypothetical protein K6U87_04115 [Firmicutes bacterium]|nr:hypothetical protein [Bacillota bacterium]
MLVKLALDPEADADLIAAIAAWPRGERSARAKALLRLALAGTGGLLARVEALERRVAALERGEPGEPSGSPGEPPKTNIRKATVDLLRQFGALDD